jgi:hypothetical protein
MSYRESGADFMRPIFVLNCKTQLSEGDELLPSNIHGVKIPSSEMLVYIVRQSYLHEYGIFVIDRSIFRYRIVSFIPS